MTITLIALLIAEIISINGCKKLNDKWFDSLLLTIYNSGYKIKKDEDEEFGKAINKAILSKKKAALINLACRLLPGINIISELIYLNTLKNATLHDKGVNSHIESMTKREFEDYFKLENDNQRLIFGAHLLEKEGDTEVVIGFKDGLPVIADLSITSLEHDRLTPYAYTYEEVKKLAKVAGTPLMIGMVGKTPTAIVGYPSSCPEIIKVAYKREGFREQHAFVPMTEEEKQKARFIVYPYFYDEELESEYNKCIQEILLNRRISDQELFSRINTVCEPRKETDIYKIFYK